MRSYLASHGINTLLRNEFSSGVMGEVPFSEAWPQLWVSEECFDQAIQLIETASVGSDDDRDWLCQACLEENPNTFEICWNCSSPKST